ncbi:uncharacterized protein LOC108849249 [Raphanus sativus]|uniref:Uncharacterized protein LOC108849249 n=1 Tax=Raphanus sativus TaxID=3726 RepID=A0A6J0N2V1_RAPSA|nr:uncharacterized protein LOC108849249 [Raphanus sativus]
MIPYATVEDGVRTGAIRLRLVRLVQDSNLRVKNSFSYMFRCYRDVMKMFILVFGSLQLVSYPSIQKWIAITIYDGDRSTVSGLLLGFIDSSIANGDYQFQKKLLQQIKDKL